MRRFRSGASSEYRTAKERMEILYISMYTISYIFLCITFLSGPAASPAHYT